MRICKHCGTELLRKPKESPQHFKERQFCGRSCSASFNNKKFIKRPSTAVICKCGGRKTSLAERCQACLNKENFERVSNSPIENYFMKGNARIKYSQIRKWAHKVVKELGLEKKCSLCGFDAAVEICHIKPISTFDVTTPMGVVNSKENLVILCPNHHTLLDKGKLEIHVAMEQLAARIAFNDKVTGSSPVGDTK